jgi:hypothetical protein
MHYHILFVWLYITLRQIHKKCTTHMGGGMPFTCCRKIIRREKHMEGNLKKTKIVLYFHNNL